MRVCKLSGWIKFWKDTSDDPRLIEAAQRLADTYVLATRTANGSNDLSNGDALRFTANALRGALASLWCYADEHIRDDDTLPISSASLDAMIGIQGFSAILPTDWISVMDNGAVKLPGYCVKNQLIAKKKRRLNGQARTARYRARHKGVSNGVHNATVTPSVTRHNDVTNGVDQDIDLDQDKDQDIQKRHTRASRDPEWFLQFKLTYPQRAGSHDWRGALRAGEARIREGHTPGEILAGAARYCAYARATQSFGTQYVKSPKTFLGPEKHFLEDFRIPMTKAEARLNGNIDVCREFIAEGEREQFRQS